MQTSKSCCQSGGSLTVCFLLCDWCIFRVIQYFKRNLCALSRSSLFILYGYCNLLCNSISRQFIQHSNHAVFADHFSVRNFCVKYTGVNHHRSGRSIRKPSFIQDFFRLTCSKEIPFTVTPDFYPCMIVITMRPFRRIHLARRNAHTSQGIHCKYRLLTTSSITSSIYGNRR